MRLPILGAALLLGFAGTVSAQSQLDTETQAARTTAMTTVASGSAGQFAPLVSIESTTKDKVVTAQLGFQFRSWSLTTGLSGAIDNNGGPTVFADLNGLRDKTTASVSVAWERWPQSPDAPTAACAALSARLPSVLKPKADCGYLILKQLLDTAVQQKALTKSDARAMLSLVPVKAMWYAAANGKLAPETFAFVSATDLANGKETHTSWSAGGSAGVLLGSGWLIAASVTREVSFQAGQQVQLCSPLGSTGALECAQKTIGPPGSPQSTNQIGAEVRRYFGESFAVSPRITYDKAKDAVALNVPLYFVKSSQGGLNGGVSFGWRSDTRSFTVSAFAGAVLGLITS